MSKSGLQIKIGLVLLLAGLVTGPGYGLYVTYLGGSSLGTYEPSLQPGAAGSRAYEPVVVELDPAMSPVIFQIGVSVAAGSRNAFNEYRVSYYLGERRVAGDTFSVGHGKEDTDAYRTWKALEPITVERAGEYRLVIQENTKPQVGVGGVEVKVRRNVPALNMPLLLGGSLVAAAGFALLFLGMFKPVLRPETASPEMRKVQSLYDSHPLIVAGDRIGTIVVRIGIFAIVVLAGATAYVVYMNQNQ